MAIEKMKKLQVIATASQREALMRALLLLGCVELKEQETLLDDPRTACLVSRACGDVTAARTRRQTFADAIRILDSHAPVKTPFLAPKPEIRQNELMDDSREDALLEAAKDLIALEEKLRALDAAEAKEQTAIEALAPWRGSGAPLDYCGTKHVAAEFGTVAASTNMDAFSAALTEAADASEIVEVSVDNVARYLIVFYLREEDGAVQPVLRAFGFSPPAFGAAKGSAADGIAAATERIRAIGTERIETEARIAECARNREQFRICFDRAGAVSDCEEETGKLLLTEGALMLDAWALAEREPEIRKVLEDMDCAYEFADPAEEEYPEVPVRLKNNRLTDGLNMVTNMYALPQYGTVDPNPLMAPFFILFFGIMMADMGYGIIMILLGALILLKKKPTEGFLKYFGELLVEGGIATFVMGILTGGLFGDAPKWIVRLINPESTWEGFPALIDPLNDTVKVLVGAMILGFIHLVAGMVISFVMKVRKGETADAIWEEGAMWLVFIGAACAFLKVGSVNGIPVPLIVALLLYCYGKSRSGKGIGKLIAIFSGIYSDVTGWFGDILSYARLMALMLAGSVIAQVFNTLGAMPGSIWVFIPICIFGNALNFGLNLLGCYVHDLRLQCLEFFNKFYVAGGKPFEPLSIRSKYYNVVK